MNKTPNFFKAWISHLRADSSLQPARTDAQSGGPERAKALNLSEAYLEDTSSEESALGAASDVSWDSGKVRNLCKDRVYETVATIPELRVMTYGQIAAICGSPRGARQVGGLAHYGPLELPWHRVVNKSGTLASGYYGGRIGHKKDLEAEGFEVSEDFQIDIDKHIYWPDE